MSFGRDAGGAVGELGRLDGRVERDDVLVPGDPRRAPRLHARQHVDGQVGSPLCAVLRNDDDRGRAIAHRTAVIELDRIGDRLRLADDVEGQLGAELGQRILQPVRLVLDDDGRHLVAGGAVFCCVNAPGEAEQSRKRQSRRPIRPIVHRAVESLRHLTAGRVGHLFDADDERCVAQAGADRQHGMAEGDAARSARTLDLGAWDVLEAELIGNDAGENLLPAERPGDEVAEVESADLLARHARIPERGIGGLDGQAFEAPAFVFAEECRADAGDGDVTHCRSPSEAGAGRS